MADEIDKIIKSCTILPLYNSKNNLVTFYTNYENIDKIIKVFKNFITNRIGMRFLINFFIKYME